MTADQLRKSILQWAIRGKLTKQNSDESAADLLNEIRSEKQKLIEENKVKKMDLINSFIYKNPGDNCYYEKFEDGREEKIEVPFEIPDNWRWVRINCAYQYIPTGVKKYSGSKKYFSTGSINYDNITPEQECLFNGRPTRANRIVYYNQIIEARMINTNKATIIDERLDGQLVSTGFFCYQVVLGEIEYLKIIFDSHYFKKTKNSLCTGTTQKSINDENLSKILVPLAPLEEQRRIVELIHKLDSLIGKYSKFEIELSELEEELPTKLENSIINYAMEGKLVKQDQNNDSVDNLINEIYKEKQKLVEQGKLKKADLNNLIIYKNDNDNSYYEKFENGREEKIEVPFEIPYNWIWSRFNKVVNFKIGKTPPTNDLSFWNGKIPWVSISDMIKNSKIKSTKKFISKKALSSYFNNNLVKKETLIMSFKLI